MTFPRNVRDQALVSAGRCCCICHRFCGLKIECHHIRPEADGGENSVDNCIPLCFDCHADQLNYDASHPRGTKYSPSELRRHRDSWLARVSQSPGIGYDEAARRLDVVTYKVIARMLPWDGAIRLLRTFSVWGYAIPHDASTELHEFLRRRDVDPNFEFMDADLEHLRVDLMTALDAFLTVKMVEMFPSDDGTESVIPPEWKLDQYERYSAVAERLDATANVLCNAYDNLVRVARRKLKDDIADVVQEQA